MCMHMHVHTLVDVHVCTRVGMISVCTCVCVHAGTSRSNRHFGAPSTVLRPVGYHQPPLAGTFSGDKGGKLKPLFSMRGKSRAVTGSELSRRTRPGQMGVGRPICRTERRPVGVERGQS